MSAMIDKVRSLWIPLRGMNLLLPNVAVAEVVPYREPDAVEQSPEWLLGGMRWRDQLIPVVSYENICGLDAPETGDRARIIILNTVRDKGQLAFYALVTSGIPRLFLADEEGLGDALEADECASDQTVAAVRIGSETADIPDLDRLQESVEKAWRNLQG